MRMRIAQLNLVTGNPKANAATILVAYEAAKKANVDLMVTPELALTGYPPRDLLQQSEFRRAVVEHLRALMQHIDGPALLLGTPVSYDGDPLVHSDHLSNGAVLIENGRIVACHRKVRLPNYDVFDERRYFTPGTSATVAQLNGRRIGLGICEDAWYDPTCGATQHYENDPIAGATHLGAEMLIVISASPYALLKQKKREHILSTIAKRIQRPLVYVNQVGGNDALVFDGRSCAVTAEGDVVARLPAFRSACDDLVLKGQSLHGTLNPLPQTAEEDVLAALTLGLRDYTHKCGFSRAVVGLSGGIDSAVTAAIAVRALGCHNVRGITMPSRYSSRGATCDATELATRLGIHMDTLPIEPMFSAFLDTLAKPFEGLDQNVAEENLQARIRGALLMAYANKFPQTLLITTGNKSEIAVGYCTLYGDMCGGIGVIGDVYKTQVYALAKYINAEAAGSPPIPESTITKEPSAELRPMQRDQDSLPSYDILDPILHAIIEERANLNEIPGDSDLVTRIGSMVERAEYKRRQMPPCLRISNKAFGEGRRLPLARGETTP